MQETIPDFGIFNTVNGDDDDDDDVVSDDEWSPTASLSPTLAPSLAFPISSPTPSVVLTPDCRSGRLKQMFQSVLN